MSDLTFTKGMGVLLPANEESREWLAKLKIGEPVSGKFSRQRNYRFLKKYMALLNLAYDYWETGDDQWRGQPVLKNFDRFREDVQILAGYGEPVYAINGEFRMRSKSISFAKMNEETFGKLYQAVLSVLLDRVLKHKGFSRESVESTVNQLLDFC